MTHQALLRHAAQRASKNPFFLASALLHYQNVHQLCDTELASWLETENLWQLALCRCPGSPQEVQQVAVYAQCNAKRLAQVLKL